MEKELTVDYFISVLLIRVTYFNLAYSFDMYSWKNKEEEWRVIETSRRKREKEKEREKFLRYAAGLSLGYDKKK